MTEKGIRGLQGEAMARAHLEAQGYGFLIDRFRGDGGEIDLVMEQGETVVFVEVKYRPAGRRGEGFMALDARKQARMAKAARLYLIRQKLLHRPCRFDAVEITKDGICHIENAFTLDGILP